MSWLDTLELVGQCSGAIAVVMIAMAWSSRKEEG